MLREGIFLFAVGILALLSTCWLIYTRPRYASAWTQTYISEPKQQSIKNGLQNEIANASSPTAKSFASTLVSYVYGGGVINATVETNSSWIFSNDDNRTDICDDNLDVFLKCGYSPNLDIDFAFTLLPGRQVPKKLQELARASTNVFIRRASWDCGVDLCQHQFVVDRMREGKNYSEFIFLNCGARGPYGFAQGRGQSNGSIWYRNVRSTLTTYDAMAPTLSGEVGYHLQSYMIAVSSRSIHVIDTLWNRTGLSKQFVLMKLQQFNTSVKHFGLVEHFLTGRKARDNKFLRIALGELGLSFVLLSNGQKLYATCFDARTLGAVPGTNPTICSKKGVADKCKDPKVTHISSADCLNCPQLEPNRCIFVKFGGDIVREELLSPWTYARVSEYDFRDLGYRLRIANKK